MKQGMPPSLEPVASAVSSVRTRRASMVWPVLVLPMLVACASTESPKTKSTAADSEPPSVQILQPQRAARVEGDSFVVEVEYTDRGSGVNANSFRALINGQDVSGSFDQHNRGANGRISSGMGLQLGENKLTAQITDRTGNIGRAEVSFLYAGSGWLTVAAIIRGQAGQVKSLALSPEGKTLVSGGEDGTIRLWDLTVPEPKVRTVLKGHRRSVTALAFSADGRMIASGSEDGTVRLWDMDGPAPRERAVLRGHWRGVSSLAFSPDGKTLASGSKDATIRLWSPADSDSKERPVLKGHVLDVSALAFSPGGKMLASGGWDQTVRLWNLERAEPKAMTVLKGHSLDVSYLAFAPDGKALASGSWDQTIRLWRLPARESADPAVYVGHREKVSAMAFSRDGKTVTSIADDGQVLMWDAGTGDKITEAKLPVSTTAVAFTAGGRNVVIGYDSGIVYVLQGDQSKPMR